MRKQAEQLVVGRVYADVRHNDVSPSFLRFIGMNDKNRPQFTRVKGGLYGEDENGIIQFSLGLDWYELTPEEDAIYNKPSEQTFTLSDIQLVIERIEREAKCLDTFKDSSLNHIKGGLIGAITIMRDELKIK